MRPGSGQTTVPPAAGDLQRSQEKGFSARPAAARIPAPGNVAGTGFRPDDPPERQPRELVRRPLASAPWTRSPHARAVGAIRPGFAEALSRSMRVRHRRPLRCGAKPPRAGVMDRHVGGGSFVERGTGGERRNRAAHLVCAAGWVGGWRYGAAVGAAYTCGRARGVDDVTGSAD